MSKATHPEIAAAATRLQQAKDKLTAHVDAMRADARAAWLMEGGCNRCGGSGRVVTWSTLDGPSWTEYGPCPGHVVGDVVVTNAWYFRVECDVDRWLSGPYADRVAVRDDGDVVVVADIPCTASTIGEPAKACAPQDMHDAVDDLRVALERATEQWSAKLGAYIVVARGRKVPQGTEGYVVHRSDGEWGIRVGIAPTIDGRAVHYTSVDNVDVITPSPVWSLGDMAGTPKQVAWAEQIRLRAVVDGSVSLDVADQHYSARWWIDTHGKRSA